MRGSSGAKHFNPNVKILSAYVGSFSDIAKGKEVTLSLIERGADVVTATGNESVIGTLEAAKEKKVLMIGTAFDSAAIRTRHNRDNRARELRRQSRNGDQQNSRRLARAEKLPPRAQ